MDVIDTLPPGLYEMEISPRSPGEGGGLVTGDWISRFEARSLDDIRALGRNSPDDDRAFAAAARLSELNHSSYRTFMQPFVRAMASQPAADMMRTLNPLRLSYTMFADSNPWIKGVEKLAAEIAAGRQPAAAGNPFLVLQKQISDQIIAMLNAYRDARDALIEQMFFGFYGSPFVQGLLGLNTGSKVRELPGSSPERRKARQARMEAYAAKLESGGFAEALARAVLYVVAAERALDDRSALALNIARQKLMRLSLEAFKELVRDQFFVLLVERERAIGVLGSLVPEEDARKELLEQVNAIVGAAGPLTPAERVRIDRLSQVLSASSAMLLPRPTPRRATA